MSKCKRVQFCNTISTRELGNHTKHMVQLICSMRQKRKVAKPSGPQLHRKEMMACASYKMVQMLLNITLHDYSTSNVLPSEKGRVGSNQLLLSSNKLSNLCSENGPKEPPKTARDLLSLFKEGFTSLTAIQAKTYHMGANT